MGYQKANGFYEWVETRIIYGIDIRMSSEVTIVLNKQVQEHKLD